MKVKIFLFVFMSVVWVQCSKSSSNSIRDILSKEKTTVNFSSFFDTGNNREVTNLDAKIEVSMPKKLAISLKPTDAALKYDKEGEKKTIESLNQYLTSLKSYTRYVFGFEFDSIQCKVYTTQAFDVIRIIMIDKRDNTYRYMNESYFVSGTILKVIDTQIKGKSGDFSEAIKEKITVSLFDENKMFYKTEEKHNLAEHVLKLNNEDAFYQMQDAFLFRQFCADAASKLKDSYPDLFKEQMVPELP